MTAVDVSDLAIEQATEMAVAAGVAVAFAVVDLAIWEPPVAAFDLVLLSYMQAPPSMRIELHRKAARALVPGGMVFLIAHHKTNLEHGIGGPPSLEYLFDEDEVAGDFPGFTAEVNEPVKRRVDSGDVVGEAIDLLFVARKA